MQLSNISSKYNGQPMIQMQSVSQPKFSNFNKKQNSILQSDLQKVILKKSIYEIDNAHRHKDTRLLMLIGFILAISDFQYGYSLSEISTVPLAQLKIDFNIEFDLGVAKGLMVGITPVGGMIGALLNQLFIKYLTRKHTHYVICSLNLISTVLVQITSIESLLVGRFVLGICLGVYTTLALLYLKQIIPKNLIPVIGPYFGLGKVSGVLLCYIFGYLLSLTGWKQFWRLVFVMPGVLSLIQAFGIVFFVPDSPVEMIEKDKINQAREAIATIYQQQYVEEVLEEYIIARKIFVKDQQNGKAEIDKYSANKLRAYLMAIQVNFLRQFTGGNTLIAYGGSIVREKNSSIGSYNPMIINGVQALYTFLYLFYISKAFGRRPLFLVATALITIINLVLTIASYYELETVVIVFLILFMAVFGGMLNSMSWAYPTQIIPAKQTTFPIFCNWFGLSIVTIFPPIISEAIPGNGDDIWPVFCFFTVYCFLAQIYMYFYLIESQGIPYKILITKF